MAEPGLQRIAFVTSHYATLRGGVTRAIFAPLLLAVGALQFLLEYLDPSRSLTGLILGLANIFGFAALGIVLWLRSRRWMDRRFGRVLVSAPLVRSAAIVACQIGYAVVSRVDDSYGPGLPSAKFMFIAAVALWCCVRLWPYSVHYGLLTLVTIGFALPFATLATDAAVELWEIRAFVTTILGWMVAGLIDLAMLFKAMPQRPQEGPVAVDA